MHHSLITRFSGFVMFRDNKVSARIINIGININIIRYVVKKLGWRMATWLPGYPTYHGYIPRYSVDHMIPRGSHTSTNNLPIPMIPLMYYNKPPTPPFIQAGLICMICII